MCESDIVEAAARQMLRAFRGGRSQLAFSRRLGFRGNAVASWEAGRRFPTASQAIRAARVGGCDLDAAFRAFEPTCVPAGYDKPQLSDWLNRLRGRESVSDLSTRSGLSEHAIRRALRGETELRLPDWLRVIDAATARVSDWVAALVDIEQVSALSAEHTLKHKARALAFDEPWSSAVLRVLETAGYQAQAHQPGYIAATLGIDHATEARTIAQLLDANIVRWDGSRYVPDRELTIDARAPTERLYDLRRHWASVSSALVGKAEPANRFSYNVFSCSAADFERVREKSWEFYHQVRGIIAASSPAERAGLLTIHLIEWSPPAETATR